MSAIFSTKNILLNQKANSVAEAIDQTGQLMVKNHHATEKYILFMHERHAISPIYIGNGIALPHGIYGSDTEVLDPGIVFLRYPEGVSFGDEIAYIFIGLALKGNDHIEYLENIALTVLEEENVEKIKSATRPEEIIQILGF